MDDGMETGELFNGYIHAQSPESTFFVEKCHLATQGSLFAMEVKDFDLNTEITRKELYVFSHRRAIPNEMIINKYCATNSTKTTYSSRSAIGCMGFPEQLVKHL